MERESPGPSGVRSGSPLGWHDPDGSGRGSGGGPGSWEGQGPRSKNPRAAQRRGVLGAAQPFDWGAGCGRRCWVFRWSRGRPPKPGSPRRLGGVTGATSSTGTRCGGPGLPIGTALAVCASAWLMFRWCWVRQLVRRLSRPDRVRQQRVGGPGWARWRSRCHPTTPARRHMKYEGFVKKCRHVRPFGTMAP